jgi:hypothetical protein
MSETLLLSQVIPVQIEDFPDLVTGTLPGAQTDSIPVRDGFHVDMGDVLAWGYTHDIYKHSGSKLLAQEIRVYQVGTDGEPLGYGIMSKDLLTPAGRYDAHSYVGFTLTVMPHRGRGLAIDRLRLLNRFAMDQYASPLHSSHVSIAESAQRVWEKLVDSGEAEQYVEYNPYTEHYFPRWKFIVTSTD